MVVRKFAKRRTWVQLSSGHWAGHDSMSRVFVSVDAYPVGEQPERFKFEAGRPATEEERSEYFAKYRKHMSRHSDEQFPNWGWPYSDE